MINWTSGIANTAKSPNSVCQMDVSGAVAGAAEGTGKAATQAVQGAGEIVEGTGDIIMAPVKAVTN